MYTNIIIFVTAILISRYIYSYYKEANDYFESNEHYQLVSDYFIGEKMRAQKPILWIHTSTEINARNWESFYSRNTTSLNQPYLQITMKSIYDQCNSHFNICLVDDDVFRRLLSWNIDLDDLAEPMKTHYRQLGMCMILHTYGGMFVPQSFLCRQNLSDLYQSSMFVVEEVNHSVQTTPYVPGLTWMGCNKRCPIMKKCIDYLETLYKNKTQQMDLKGDVHTYLKQSGCTIVDGIYIGIKKKNGNPILLQDLVDTHPLSLPDCAYGVYVPRDEILKRPKFEWLSRMSTKQLLESPIALSTCIHNFYSL